MKHKGDWMLLLAAAIGGGGFISVKYLLDWGYSAYQIMFGRFLVATICLGLFYWRQIGKITREEWKAGSVLGGLLAATFLLLTLGLQYTTPSVNAFLCNTQAVVVPFICWIAFKQKPAPALILAAMLTVIGVAMLSVTDGLRLDLGAVLSFGASIAFSLQMAFMGRMLARCDSIRIALVENAVVAVLAFFIALFMGGAVPVLSVGAVGNFLYAGVLCTGIYFVLQSVGQRYTSANKTALIITTESIFAALISAVLYGERLTFRGYLGCAVIFGAVLLAEAPIGKSKKKEVDSDHRID